MRPGFVRIIAGKWRGRTLPILAEESLRPTPDRVRETLFNWLTPYVAGAVCLDAFAGSGALGFEAISRGAKHVVMVDNMNAIVQQLKTIQALLQADEAEIYCAKMPSGLRPITKPFDIVFIDPPYASNLWHTTCHYLESNHYLADSAYIYLEANQLIQDNSLPAHWQMIKAKRAGSVFYHLAHRVIKHD